MNESHAYKLLLSTGVAPRWMFSAASVCWLLVSVCVCVCHYVSVFVRTITSERLNVGRSNLAVRYSVQKSRPSSKFKVKGQGHQGQKKRKKLPSHPHWQCAVAKPYAARSTQQQTIPLRAARGSDGLRWLEISACCLVLLLYLTRRTVQEHAQSPCPCFI